MQYIISGSMPAVPVPNDMDNTKYCLPPGLWTDFLTGREYGGGMWIEAQNTCPHMMIPENSIVAVDPCGSGSDYGCAGRCELRVYAVRDAMKIDTDIYGMDGTVELSISLRRQGRTITVTSDGSKPYILRMVNMCAKNAVNGFLTVEGNDSIVTPDSGANVIEITF